MKKPSNKKRRIWLIILLSFVIFLFSICISAIVIFKHYYGMMNIENQIPNAVKIKKLNIEKDENIYEEQTMLVLESEDEIFPPEVSDTTEILQDTETVASTEVVDSILSSEVEESTITEPTTSVQTSEVTAAQETTVIQTTQETLPALEEGTDGIFRVLLIGVDSRENIRGRSDTMILFDINPDTKKIVMTSLLRDIYVDIPGHKSNRLNAAYALGGAKLLTQTISKSFGIEIDKYVIVNFRIVIDVVDALGGVEVDVTKEELDHINQGATGTNRLPDSSIGKVRLNGNQALVYSRIRKTDSDFGRTSRQREIVSASIEKIKKLGIFEINDMLNQFLPRVTTNLTEKDVVNLLLMALKRKDYSIESMALPVDGTWKYATIDGKAVIKIDFAANAKAWYKKVVGE